MFEKGIVGNVVNVEPVQRTCRICKLFRVDFLVFNSRIVLCTVVVLRRSERTFVFTLTIKLLRTPETRQLHFGKWKQINRKFVEQ